jgi:hypothetical protein
LSLTLVAIPLKGDKGAILAPRRNVSAKGHAAVRHYFARAVAGTAD